MERSSFQKRPAPFLEVNILPHLGKRPIVEIDAPELLAVLYALDIADLKYTLGSRSGITCFTFYL